LKTDWSFSKYVMLVIIALLLGLVIFMNAYGQGPIPPEVKQFAGDWPLPNKDYANTRATFTAGINSHNINNTKMVWSVPINANGAFGGASSNPLILGETVYFQDIDSNLFSYKLDNGKLNWKNVNNLTILGPNGPAVGWGKVFAAKGAFNLTALDLNAGKELWSTNISTGRTVGIDIQPIAYNDKVYVSTVPGSNITNFYTGGGIGIIYALDQKTGKVNWNFSTVDSADIWGNKEINSGGGCWYTPAIDTKTNAIFWGVGNPAPWPGTP